MKKILWWIALLALVPMFATAQQMEYTSTEKFPVGEHEAPVSLRTELRDAVCGEIRGEAHVIVRGHYDSREYPLDNHDQQFFLGLRRGADVAQYMERVCAMHRSNFSVQSSFAPGDPDDPQGNESRTVTIIWGFSDTSDFQTAQDSYNMDLEDFFNEFLNPWKELDLANQAEMLEIMRSVDEKMIASQLQLANISRQIDELAAMSWKLPRWSFQTGMQFSSKFGTGFTFSLCRNYFDQNIDFCLKAFAENESHEAQALHRPYPNQEVLHWGKWYSASLIIRPYLKSLGESARIFMDLGIGVAHVNYNGPPDKSIGYNTTGIMPSIGFGLKTRWRSWGLEFVGTEEVWMFPQGVVLPSFEDGDYHVSLAGSFALSYHF